MAFTFRGTYTKNRGDLAAAGTVAIKSRVGVTLDTATLDANGSYELVLDEQEGEITVVETMEGVAVRSYSVGVSRGSITDTSRDIGYVGPGAAGGGGADLPTPGAGDAGKFLAVTAEEDGYELQQSGASVAADVTFTPAGAIAATDVQAALVELDTEKAAASVLAASGKGWINHGATAGTARPTGYASVEWYGSVEPTNAANGDTWVDTSV